MSEHFIRLQVIYEDLPNLIELGVHVVQGDWSARATAYTSPSFFVESGNSLLRWVGAPNPNQSLLIEAGADTGIGWIALSFFTIDRAGHVRCAINLATKTRTDEPRPSETSRFAIELPTELGLIEKFAGQCLALGDDYKGEVRLLGLPSQVDFSRASF